MYLFQKEESKRRVNKANHEGEQQGSPYPVNVAPAYLNLDIGREVDDYQSKERIKLWPSEMKNEKPSEERAFFSMDRQTILVLMREPFERG